MNDAKKSRNQPESSLIRREIQRANGLIRSLTAALLAILLLVLTGPFGTYEELTLSVRILFWTLAIGGIAPLMQFCISFFLLQPRLQSLPIVLRLGLGSAMAAFPASAWMYFINVTVRPEIFNPDTLLNMLFQIFVIGIFMGFIHYRLHRHILGDVQRFALAGEDAAPKGLARSRTLSEPSPESCNTDERAADDGEIDTVTGRPVTPFLKRLPKALGDDLVSVSMQDHYLNVTTAAGSTLLRTRLADALLELGDYPGTQIHRSHWAARDHAVSVRRQGSIYSLVLDDGRKLPVSRTFLAAARALVGDDEAGRG